MHASKIYYICHRIVSMHISCLPWPFKFSISSFSFANFKKHIFHEALNEISSGFNYESKPIHVEELLERLDEGEHGATAQSIRWDMLS